MALFERHKPVTVSKTVLQRSIYLSSGMTYSADLEQSDYVFVPDMAWLLKNCPKSKKWQKDWNCTKIAVAAWAALQTHAVGLIKLEWPDDKNTHTLLLVGYENGGISLFDPHSRAFFSIAGKKIFRLWM